MSKKTVIVDFDGVIHGYDSGWKGAAVCPDPIVPGTREGIARIRELGFEVIVVSSRCHQEGGIDAIQQYLAENGIIVDGVTNDKPPHVAVIDDRGFRFEGDWERVILFLSGNIDPWNKK